MGDRRFLQVYRRVANADQPVAEIRSLSDEEVTRALAATSEARDPYLANVLATEALNRLAERDRLERALNESEQRYRSLFKHNPDAVFSFNDEGEFTSANPGCERLSGRTPEELLGTPFTDYLAPEEVGLVVEHFLGVLAGEPQRFETALVHKDGRRVEVNVTGIPMVVDGAVVGAYGVAKDITSRKRTKGALEARERQQAAVADLGQLALAGVELQELFDAAVTAVADTLGVEYCKVLDLQPDGEALLLRAGVGWREGLVGSATVGAGLDSQAGYTLVSDDPVIVRDLREEERFSGPPLLHDHDVVSGISVIIQGADGPWGVMGAHTTREREFTRYDVSFLQSVANVLATVIQRRRRDRALRTSEARFRTAFEDAAIGMALIAPDGRYLRANAAMRNILGYTEGELRERNYDGITHPDDVERSREQVRRMLAGDISSCTFEKRYVHRDGHVVWTQVTASLVRGDDGEPQHFISQVRDITERKRREAELAAHRERLEGLVAERTRALQEANRELEAFAYRTSHDLKSHLRAMDFFTEVLIEDYGDAADATHRDYLQRLRDESQRLSDLVADLLDLSRAGRAALEALPVDISRMARDVAAELRERDPDHTVELRVEDGLVAMADPSLIQVALENLLGNAWKYTRDAGHPRVEVGALGEPEPSTGAGEGSATVFYVRDNGAGFPPEEADRLFEPFERLHGGEFEGTGVGLATVKRVVERHGGRVWAESEGPGEGATFYFTLGARRQGGE